MKLKDYLHSLVSKRKTNVSVGKFHPKSIAAREHHATTSATDGHYEICEYEDINRLPPMDDQHGRTQLLLSRHAELVNTIVRARSPQKTCPHCHSCEQESLFMTRPYSATLTACGTRSYDPHPSGYLASFNPTVLSSSNHSLWTRTRQRSKIRTNPWIKTGSLRHRTSPADYCSHSSAFHPSSAGLIHSESFPQTICNGSGHATKPTVPKAHVYLHHSDSGHGFSLTSSRMIDSSSSPEDTVDAPISSSAPRRHPPNSKHAEQYFPRRTRKPSHTRQKKSSIDQFSLEFEDILENNRLPKSRSPVRKSPFIFPLDETRVCSPTLAQTNANTILKHIEEIENEIRLIRNLNLDQGSADEPDQAAKRSIHEQVNQWIDECLTVNDGTPVLSDSDPSSAQIDDRRPSPIDVTAAFYRTATKTHPCIDQLAFTRPDTHAIKSTTNECPF